MQRETVLFHFDEERTASSEILNGSAEFAWFVRANDCCLLLVTVTLPRNNLIARIEIDTQTFQWLTECVGGRSRSCVSLTISSLSRLCVWFRIAGVPRANRVSCRCMHACAQTTYAYARSDIYLHVTTPSYGDNRAQLVDDRLVPIERYQWLYHCWRFQMHFPWLLNGV